MRDHGGEPGQLLAHDGVIEVWRVDKPFDPPSVHGHGPGVPASCPLAQGIDFVPEPLGYDSEGREVLSFVEGDVPTEPLPDAVWGEGVLVALAGLIRRLHDAAESWPSPVDATWGSIPGQQHVAVPPLFDRPELVAH